MGSSVSKSPPTTNVVSASFLWRSVESVRREWRLFIADRVAPVAIITIGLLTLLALFAGWQRTNQNAEYLATLDHENTLQRRFLESTFQEEESSDDLSPSQIDRQSELQMSAKSPDMMRYVGEIWWALYPASPMSVNAMGASDQWPDHYCHAGSSTTQTIARTVDANPSLASIGAFDLALVIGAILPLAVIALTYNVIASDREQGRWPLVRLHASSISQLVIIRCLVRVAALAVTVIVLNACFTLPFIFNQSAIGAMGGFFVWCGWVVAYSGFWLALAISVNSLRLSSSGAGLLLLFCWGMLVIAIPSVVQRAANRMFPIPSQAGLIAIEEEIQEQAEQEEDKIWAEFLLQNPDFRLDDENPQQEYLLRDIALNQTIRSRVRDEIDGFFGRFLERESFLDRCQFLSPLLAWRTAADQSAGVSLRHYVSFTKQTCNFHDDYIRYFEPFSISGQELSQADIQAIPRFQTNHLGTRLDLLPLLASAGSLLFWFCIAGAISWWNLRRLATP